MELAIGVDAERLLRRPDLLLAEGRAVGGGRALRVRRRPGDRGAHSDQGGAVLLVDRGLQRARERGEAVCIIDGLYVPAVGAEARSDVLRVERKGRVAVDRDVVVVVDVDDAAEAEVPRERGRLRG